MHYRRELLLTANRPLGLGYSTLESAMNIELEEFVVQDVSDDALELAAGGAQGGPNLCGAQGGPTYVYTSCGCYS